MNDITLFSAELNEDLPQIDLHNAGIIPDALEQLNKELFLFYSDNIKLCRVIHGIGTGALERAVHEELTKNPMVVHWKKEERGGSCLVQL